MKLIDAQLGRILFEKGLTVYSLQLNRSNAVRSEQVTTAEVSSQIMRGPRRQLSLVESRTAVPEGRPPVVAVPDGSQQPMSALFAGAQEDLNRLYNVLRQARYEVLLCDDKGTVLDHRGLSRFPQFDLPKGKELFTRPRGGQLIEIAPGAEIASREAGDYAAPIFDPDGRLVGTLRVALSDLRPGQHTDQLTSAMVRATARSIEERLFRQRYCDSWIVAVAQGGDTTAAVLFAVDQNHQIVGADRSGRAMLAGCVPSSGQVSTPLWFLFEKNTKPFESKHRGADITASLVPHGVAETWPALITPPEPATRPWRSPDPRLHARPRIDSIGSMPQIAPAQPARGGLSPSTLRRVREHLEQNLEASFDLQGLADLAGLSRWHFARAFKQSAGMTPYNYLMFRRLTKAQDLLVNSDLPLCEITLETGFSDQSQFTRRFREFVGISPGAFRRSKR